MALINTGSDYTRTGQTTAPGFANTLTRWSNKLSMIPWVGGALSLPIGLAGTVMESVGWLVRGNVLSAATALTAGTVSTAVNTFVSTGANLNPFYWGQLASGAATGSTLGTHSRALTEGAIGMVTGALGVRPMVLRSYNAGVGSVGAGAASRPGRFAAAEAGRRGQDSNQLWSQKMSGEAGAYVSPSLTGQRGVA